MIKTRDMLRELGAAHEGLTEARRAWLEARGVSKIAFIAAGGVGVRPVVAWGDGTFEAAGEGSEHAGDAMAFNAVVVGAWSRPFTMAAPDAVGAGPELIDQVAFDPRRPECWWRRTRTAFALGEDRLCASGYGIAGDGGSPVRLCATPLSWLAALEGAAVAGSPWPVCLLGAVAGLTGAIEGEETRYPRDVLAGAGSIVCDDAAHAARVYAALRKRPAAPRLPEVFIRQREEHAA